MKIIIKFLFRVLLLPITIPALSLTAFVTYADSKPDWEYWKNYNNFILKLLPWAKYK